MKLILAPMAAISHSGLRRLIQKFGEPDEYFSEMIHAPSAIAGGGFEKWYFQTAPSPEKLVWQITSPEVDAAEKVVPLLLQYGGIGIDLNMGCCAPQIVNTGAGFAWMKKKQTETAAFVKAVKRQIISYEQNSKKQIRLSVKLRLGETEDYHKLVKFCGILISEGVELITLHPRTQKQKYSKPCKHEYTALLAQDLNIPVYGNGDINSAKKFAEFSSKYKCSGWMIGRAAVQKPWIFSEIATRFSAPPDLKNETSADNTIDLLETAQLFIKLLKEEQPPEFYLTRAQRFFAYFCDNFQFAHHIKTKILNSKDLETMLQKLEKYFEDVPSDRLKL